MFTFVSRKPFLFASALLIALLAVVAACGGDDNTAPTQTAGASASAGAADHPDPEPTIRDLLDKLNSNDLQGFYDGLTAERRAETSVSELERGLNNAQALTGRRPQLEVDNIADKRITGDDAEIDATLNVKVGSQMLPVTATAIMKWEDDAWHLGDHFIDQALAVLGLGGGGGTATPTP